MTTATITALDGTFLELEDADRTAHMHIGGILVFAPLPHHRAPGVDEVRAHVDERIDALPRYRQRLSSEHPGPVSWPQWRDDERFDIAHHVHRAALPRPGGWEELLEWAGEFYARRLDRTRPLWEIVLVEGLADGHWALATKTHHTLVDGVGSVDVAHLLLDADPDVPRRVAGTLARRDDDGHGLGLPRWIPAGAIARAVRGSADLAAHPGHAREAVRRLAAAAEVVVRDEIQAAPRTSLNRPIGADRVLRGVRIPLDEAKLVKRELGGTVNDVVLAGVAGGLRTLLRERGETLPARGLRAMVPMNVRGEDEHPAELGNRLTSLFVDLPVADADPVARYRHIAGTTDQLKRSTMATGAQTLVEIAGLAPPVVHAFLARSLFGTRLFNLTVTNIPGPQQTLYALGGALKAVYPLVPLAAEHAVGIAITSYDGQLCFGINADADSFADVDVLAAGIVDTLAELQRAAHAEG
jgi:WS/DGAT/MGAT family acyltransferase